MKMRSIILVTALMAATLGAARSQMNEKADTEAPPPAGHGAAAPDVAGVSGSLAGTPSNTPPVIPFRRPLPDLSVEDQQELARHYHSSRMSKQGNVEARKGNWAQAADDYRQALSLWPINPSALYGMGRCADAAGDTATAIKCYRERIYKNHQTSDATDRDQGYLENSPNRLMEYALLLDKTGQEGEALAVYRRALTTLNYDYDSIGPAKTRSVPRLDVRFPEFGPGEWAYTPQRLRAMIHLALGTYASNFGPELPHLQEAVRLAPDSAVAYYYLGKNLLGRGREGGKAALEKAAQLGDDRTAKAAKVYLGVPN